MSALLYILLASALILGVSLTFGNAFLRATGAILNRGEAHFLAFIVGSGLLSAMALPMAALGQARRGSFLLAGLALLSAAVWRGNHRFPTKTSSTVPVTWRLAFWGIYTVFGMYYLVSALVPPTTGLSATIHMARQFGFTPGQDPVPTPSEALALFAFAIGRHSAVSMTSLLFLFALPFGIRAFAERIGHARAGIVAALLFFVSPVAGRAGTIPAPDLMIAATAFALFFSLYERLYPAAALLAGLLAWNVVLSGPEPGAQWLDITLLGDRSGLVGLAFMLSPIALLSLKSGVGRWLMLAALVCSIPFAVAPGARTLLPQLPFLSLALAITLSEWNLALPAVLAAHAVFSWPAVVPLYSNENAWRMGEFEWRTALRIEPEDRYLMRTFRSYYAGRLMEQMVPDGAKVLALAPFQELYHTRRLIQDERLRESLLSGAGLQQDDIHWVLANTDDRQALDLLSHAAERGLNVRFIQEGWVLFQTR